MFVAGYISRTTLLCTNNDRMFDISNLLFNELEGKKKLIDQILILKRIFVIIPELTVPRLCTYTLAI